MIQAPVLSAQGLCKAYRRGPSTVVGVKDVHFVAAAGTFTAIRGPSGSGKSTLLSILGTLEAPDAGQVQLAGRQVQALGRRDRALVRRRDIGFVFQDLNLLPTLTAAENVSLPLELDGVDAGAARAAAMTRLELLGVADLADVIPSRLSGGQRQRVAVARASVGSKVVLLADEPCGSLDRAAADLVLESLKAAVEEGLAVVMVTHNDQDADYADKVLQMQAGCLIGQG